MCPDLIAYELRTGEALRASARTLAALPADAPADALLAALGLRATAAAATAPAPAGVDAAPPPLLARSIEAWGFAAGIRDVAFVTVRPDRVDATIAQFPGAHVERRARNVEVGAQDRWRDDRAHGAPHVELYVARDPALARRAAALQADDPTRHAGELGALLGYPPCCVAAFVAQRARHDNSLNRYLIAARTDAPGPWPWQLNELDLRLIAFYPCRYDCPRARAVADATLAAIARVDPDEPARVQRRLTATVVYADHDHQAWLIPDDDLPEAIGYRAVRLVGGGRALPALGAYLGLGRRLRATPAELAIGVGAEVAVRLERGAPGALVARFA